MRGFQKFETAILHERDVSARQLKFKLGAVVGSSKQSGLRLQSYAGFSGLQDPLGNMSGLRRFIRYSGQVRLLLRLSV